MTLGQKLLAARLEAKLTQRELCDGIITRNMLSQIEHNTAHPSMETLRRLAGRLGKPVSFFLDEDAAVSANQDCIQKARQALNAEYYAAAREHLAVFRQPDPMLEWERQYLSFAAALGAARQALAQGQEPFARQLLTEAVCPIAQLERQRLLLLGRTQGADLCQIAAQLPSLDEELLLRAQAALHDGNRERAASLLAAAEDQKHPRWNLLQGQLLYEKRCYDRAVPCLTLAQTQYPELCLPMLEICYRELGDFQNAYLCACRQRNG